MCTAGSVVNSNAQLLLRREIIRHHINAFESTGRARPPRFSRAAFSTPRPHQLTVPPTNRLDFVHFCTTQFNRSSGGELGGLQYIANVGEASIFFSLLCEQGQRYDFDVGSSECILELAQTIE